MVRGTARPHQGQQRQDAALAAVVGTEDHGDVLERDDEIEGPEHQREDAEHILGSERNGVGAVEAFLERVKWRRADVTVDDSQRREGKATKDLARRRFVILDHWPPSGVVAPDERGAAATSESTSLTIMSALTLL